MDLFGNVSRVESAYIDGKQYGVSAIKGKNSTHLLVSLTDGEVMGDGLSSGLTAAGSDEDEGGGSDGSTATESDASA